MTEKADPAFLSSPAVQRNSVGPLVTGEAALTSNVDAPTTFSHKGMETEPYLNGNTGSLRRVIDLM